MAANMKCRVFWDVAPCRFVDWFDRVRLTSQNCGLYGPIVHPRVIALMMEAVRTSETSVNFSVTTWRNIPEYSELRIKMCFIFSRRAVMNTVINLRVLAPQS
jgi:hypothetical protein